MISDDILDTLLDQPAPPGTNAPSSGGGGLPAVTTPIQASNVSWPDFPKHALAKIRYTHDAMINMILASPGISQNELAAQFGYSASWISQIMTSDVFQARLMERSAEMIDPTLRATIEDQLKGLAARSIEIVKEKLSKPADEVTDQMAVRVMEASGRLLGYGAREQTVAVQVNVDNHLDSLASNLTKLLRRERSKQDVPQIELLTQEST